LTPPPIGAGYEEAEIKAVGAAPEFETAGWWCALQWPGVPAGGQPPGGGVGHPFAAPSGADGRHGAVRQVRDGRDQSEGTITPSRLGDH